MKAETEQYYLSEHRKSANAAYLAPLLAPLGIREGAAILDVGCGTGYVNSYLAGDLPLERNLGFDIDPDAIHLAYRLNGAAGRIGWFCASAETIPLPDASFDHVICRGALPLCHVSRVIEEIARVVRPGGTTVLLVHPWQYYLPWISLNPKRWKRTVQAVVSTASSLWFNATGHQIQLRFRGRPVGQSFQTVARMRIILRRHGLSIYRTVRQPEFLIYARMRG